MVISLAIIVLIIVLGIVFSKGGNKDSKDEVTNDTDTAMTDDTSTVVPPKYIGFSSPTTPITPPTPRLSYDDALMVYKNARIQFGETCKATPVTSTYKNGVTVMIDNRSKEGKTFTIGSVSYFVPAYDYTLVLLNYTDLPQTLYIDCGSEQNTATILVQE